VGQAEACSRQAEACPTVNQVWQSRRRRSVGTRRRRESLRTLSIASPGGPGQHQRADARQARIGRMPMLCVITDSSMPPLAPNAGGFQAPEPRHDRLKPIPPRHDRLKPIPPRHDRLKPIPPGMTGTEACRTSRKHGRDVRVLREASSRGRLRCPRSAAAGSGRARCCGRSCRAPRRATSAGGRAACGRAGN
jgi:hypothetical protein